MVNCKFETEVGIMNFVGTPVSHDFDYVKFARKNGFTEMTLNSPENTDKYGGVGFIVYRKKQITDYVSPQRLEILFQNELPVMYRIVGNAY